MYKLFKRKKQKFDQSNFNIKDFDKSELDSGILIKIKGGTEGDDEGKTGKGNGELE